VRSVEAYVRNTFAAVFRSTEQGNVPDDLKLDGRLSASNAISVGARIGPQAFSAAATTGLRNGNRIQRCFRDLQARNAHFMTGEESFINAGRYLTGIPGSVPGL
jgi:hypothetical protein